MVSTKRFRYRIDEKGKSGIKEEIKRLNKAKEYKRVTISLGISSSLDKLDGVVFKKGILKKDKEKREGVYYLLDEIAYIVTVRYELQEDGTEDIRIPMIHVPEMIISEDEIASKLVTQDFSEEVKEKIIENLKGYLREQVG